MTRISEQYALGVLQPQLDFIDVDLDTDTDVYVDPHAIRMLKSPWAADCAALLRLYFDAVLAAIKAGDTERADDLLGQLREPNQTRFGMSQGRPQGHALGDELALRVREKLETSKALKTGLIRDLEDTILMIPSIGPDLISDITTNVIRQPLIAYTQGMCQDLGIDMEPDAYPGPIWDPETGEWFQDTATLPWAGDHALLLVPKVIVRRKMDFQPGDYFHRHILPFLKQREIANGTSLVRLVRGEPRVTTKDIIERYGQGKAVNESVTRQHPELLDAYRRDKARNAPPPIPHAEIAELTDTTPPDWDTLLAAVGSVPPGVKTASAFHKAVEGLLAPLFYPWLSNPEHEAPIHGGRKRLDIRYDNVANTGFFDWVNRNHVAPTVVVECKNYTADPANPELDQVSGRFGDLRGWVGLLVCRTFADRALFIQRCRDTSLDGRGFIVALDDDDLAILVDARKRNDGHAALRHLRTRFNELT